MNARIITYRLAHLTSARSRVFFLRLLDCQPGCTIVYCRFKICAHVKGSGMFSNKNHPNRI